MMDGRTEGWMEKKIDINGQGTKKEKKKEKNMLAVHKNKILAKERCGQTDI